MSPADRPAALQGLAHRVIGDIGQVLGNQAGHVDHHDRVGAGSLVPSGDV